LSGYAQPFTLPDLRDDIVRQPTQQLKNKQPMKNILRLALVGTLLIGCVGCDQLSKEIVRSHLTLGVNQSFLGDTVRLIHVENTGAFLGLGANLSEALRVGIFQGATFLIVLGLLWVAIFSSKTPPRRSSVLHSWQPVALVI